MEGRRCRLERRSMKARLVVMAVVCALLVPAAFAQRGKQDDQLRTLTGHVYTRNEQPVAKAIVYLKNTRTLVVTTYISEPDGAYRFPALSPSVDYEIYAESNGARSDTKTLSAFDNRKQANITLHLK